MYFSKSLQYIDPRLRGSYMEGDSAYHDIYGVENEPSNSNSRMEKKWAQTDGTEVSQGTSLCR
jgi:hypothetical protein